MSHEISFNDIENDVLSYIDEMCEDLDIVNKYAYFEECATKYGKGENAQENITYCVMMIEKHLDLTTRELDGLIETMLYYGWNINTKLSNRITGSQYNENLLVLYVENHNLRMVKELIYFGATYIDNTSYGYNLCEIAVMGYNGYAGIDDETELYSICKFLIKNGYELPRASYLEDELTDEEIQEILTVLTQI